MPSVKQRSNPAFLQAGRRKPVDRNAAFMRPVVNILSKGPVRTALLAILLLIHGCADSHEPAEDYLLRVGSQRVSVSEFEQALEISKTAYSWQPEGRSELLWIIRRRLLLEMIEELLIFERAGELGIGVSERELDDYVAAIRADYPEGAFDDIFLRQAISYETWRKRTRERMLLGKVLEADLTAGAAHLTSPSMPDTGPDGAAGGDDGAGRLRAELPETDSNGRYEKWIGSLAARIPIEINTALWNKLYGS
jgi:hypothetical protein